MPNAHNNKRGFIGVLFSILIRVIILAIAIPILFIILIFMLLKQHKAVFSGVHFAYLYLNVATKLPGVWVTQSEVRDHIKKHNSGDVYRFMRTKFKDVFLDEYYVDDGVHRSEHEKVIESLITFMFHEKDAPPLHERKTGCFHPSHDRLMLYPTGDNSIGRTLTIPSIALSEKENKEVAEGTSIELVFIRKTNIGKRKPPPPETEHEEEHSFGGLKPLRT